jgi:O-antigen ligase
MTRALQGRLPVALVGVAALLVAVAVVAVTSGSATNVDAFEQAAGALAGIAVVGMALTARPAWPLSIGLALAAFSGYWDTMGVPVALDRLLIGTAVVSTLVRERIRSPDALKARPIDCLLLLVAVYAIGSSLIADTFQYESVRFALLDKLGLAGFVVFFVAPKAFREERDRRILLGTLVGLGAYLGLTALFETVGPDALVVPDYISDPNIGTHEDRARGPFAEAAANGLSLYACVIAAFIAAATWRDRRWRQVAGVVLVLCALGILLTVTRAAWIAATAATILTMLAVKETRRFVLPAAAVGGVGVLLAFAVIPGLEGQAEDRASDDRPVWDRRNATAAALRMIDDRPLLGFGWGRFQVDSPRYYRQPQDYPLTGQRQLHNVYLSNAVELGLIGALLWFLAGAVAVLGSIARRGPPELRLWKLGLLAWVICYAISALSTPLAFALPTLLLWAWAGVARGEPERRAALDRT